MNLAVPPTPPPSPAIIPFLLLISMLALASALPPPPPGGCVAELVAFSPCLPYISSPPNNMSSSASSQCCDVFSSAFENGNASCLCYLIRLPLLLGFPLNEARILSLSSLCPLRNASSGSLESLCLGPASLGPTLSPGAAPSPPSPIGSSVPESTSPALAPESDVTPVRTPATPATTTGSRPVLTSSTAKPSYTLSPSLLLFVSGILVMKYY